MITDGDGRRGEDNAHDPRRWCRMGVIEDCATDAERAGFAYAARENELGGNRPSVREAADALADFNRLGAR